MTKFNTRKYRDVCNTILQFLIFFYVFEFMKKENQQLIKYFESG